MERDAGAIMAFLRRREAKLWLLSALLASVCLQGVRAEPQLQPDVLEALKNSRQQKKNCQTSQKQSNKSSAMPVFSADMSCALKAVDVSRRLHDNELTLADNRQPADFNQNHIPGAIRLPAGELVSKTYLQNKPVILIGNGKAEGELYRQCQQLKRRGFKQVNVLWGGMPAWLTAGHPVEGQPDRADSSISLTAGEFWLESQFRANLVIVVKAQTALIKYLPNAHVIADGKPSTIKTALQRYGTKSPASVVLAVPANTDVEAIRQMLKPVPLLIYTEGVDAFSRQVHEQQVLWEAYTRGPKQPSACKRLSGF